MIEMGTLPKMLAVLGKVNASLWVSKTDYYYLDKILKKYNVQYLFFYGLHDYFNNETTSARMQI